jgi:uncharacterized protein
VHLDVRIKSRLALAFSLAAGLLLLWIPAEAAPKYPALSGRVIDAAGILPAGIEQSLAARSQALEAKTTDQFVIVTIPSLQGYSIEEYSQGLGNAWRLGQAGKDNGVLLVVAPKERKVRIEPGVGLEKVLDHETSAAIVQGVILPQFRKGDMAKGISAGAEAILDRLNASLQVAPSVAASPQALAAPAATPKPADPKPSKGGSLDAVVALAVICFVLFVLYKIITGIGRFIVGLTVLAFQAKGGGGFAPPPAGLAPSPPGGLAASPPDGYPPGYPQGAVQPGLYPQAGYGRSPFANRAVMFGAGALTGAVTGALADQFWHRVGLFQRNNSSSASNFDPSYAASSSGSVSPGGGSFGGDSSSGGGGFSGGGGSFGGGGGASGSW